MSNANETRNKRHFITKLCLQIWVPRDHLDPTRPAGSLDRATLRYTLALLSLFHLIPINDYCKKLSSLKRILRTTSATRRSKTANITKRWYYFAAQWHFGGDMMIKQRISMQVDIERSYRSVQLLYELSRWKLWVNDVVTHNTEVGLSHFKDDLRHSQI